MHACACVCDYRVCYISFPHVLPHLLQQVLLNFFTAIILDNLDLDEETKVQRLKVECVRGVGVEWGSGVGGGVGRWGWGCNECQEHNGYCAQHITVT